MKMKTMVVFCSFLLFGMSLCGSHFLKARPTDVSVGMRGFSNGPTSFIELNAAGKEKNFLSHEEMIKLESNLKDMFLAQFDGRKKKRYTRGNKPCASAFVQDKITYYDCTNTKSPDGKDKKLEWCYIDINARDSSSKTWDYCKPIIDYDKVREQNQSEMILITTECRKVNDELQYLISDGDRALKDLKGIRDGHADLDNKISKLKRKIAIIYNNLNFLLNTSHKWVKEEQIAAEISKKIEAEEAKVKKQLEEKKPEAKPITDMVALKKEEELSGMSINPVFMLKEPTNKVTCEGMTGYEEEKSGNGLIADYFDNESWVGSSIQRVDEKVSFFWTSTSPIKGINPHNFSVKWTGFLKAPFTGEYKFYLSTSDGAMLNLNNKIVIAHNMQTASPESISRNDKWLSSEEKKAENTKIDYKISESPVVDLIGGNKYKIVISYFHSIHSLIKKEFIANIQVLWSSTEFSKEIIPTKYLYSENSFPQLKPTGFDLNDAIFSELETNSLAFKDSIRYVLADIPTEYQGLKSLKFNYRFKKDFFQIYLNSPSNLFFGVLSHYPNPLPDTFENMGQMISLLQINEKAKAIDGKIHAENSAQFLLYKKQFNTGMAKVDFKKIGANKRGIPMIAFFGPDDTGASPISCGGKEDVISKPDSGAFKSCSSSSNFQGSKCEDAFSGKMQDSIGSMWYSQSEGTGAWIKINFKGLYMITKLTLLSRGNPGERNKEIELEFSDGSTQKFQLLNTDKKQEFAIQKIQTQYIIVKITQVYGTINNGGAFDFQGIECKNLNDQKDFKEANGLVKASGIKPNEIPPLFNVKVENVIDLDCFESVSNSKQFLKVKKAFGNQVIVRCYSSCANTPYMVFGNEKYTKDSALCKAAYHDKKISATGGKFVVKFSAGLKQYDEKESNGFKSYSKSYSPLTVSFEIVKEDDDIILKEGSFVDFKNPDGNGYISATIMEIKYKDDNKLISLKYSNDKLVDVAYPNKSKILPCGEKVTEGVDCKTSRKNINKFKPITIRFTPSNYKSNGDFFKDNGGVYGSSGKPFGWSKEITNRLYYHAKSSSDPIMETLAHFPPSPQSRYCKKEIPDTICDKIDWSVKAGEGKFLVKIFSGDPTVNSKIDLSINGDVISNKIVAKGKMQIIEKVVDAKEGFIVLSSNCVSDCDFSMAKINQIIIVPFTNQKKEIKPEESKEKILCGGSLTLGKCLVGDNVLHCLFDDPSNEFTKTCTGQYVLMEVPKDNTCKDQIGKFKCVKRVYENSVECTKFCPKKCKKETCA